MQWLWNKTVKNQQQWLRTETLNFSSPCYSPNKTTMVLLFPWKPLLSLLLFLSLFFYEHWISIPSCNIVPNTDLNQQEHDVVEEENDNDEVLKVMLVANLLLLGSDTSFFNLYFRDYYMSKVFKVTTIHLSLSFKL